MQPDYGLAREFAPTTNIDQHPEVAEVDKTTSGTIPTPTNRGVATEKLSDRAAGLAVAAFTSSVGEVQGAVLNVHYDGMRNIGEV